MKKFLSLVLAMVMTMSLVTVSAGAKDFTDADDIQYVEAVEVMKAVGVVDGDTAGNFNPQNGLTRGAAAKIICNMILGPTTAAALNADTNPYPDVDKDSTFAGYIAYCQKEGIISGYADGTFKPAAPLTGYAFMKMLLGALGYDPAVEGYTGANWSINVAKRAINIGLDDGLVDTFNGSDYVTREEAMLYAFNAMQADMVQYDTTITIGDITVAGSKSEVVANNAKTEGIANDDVMQFAEKYFTNLKGNSDRDEFNRPATTWKIKNETVGTYTWTPDLTYTAKVKNGEIYSDLGSKVAAKDVTVFVNGVEKTALALDIVKGGKATVGQSANGVLTEVYYYADAEAAEIVQIHTYAGTVDKTVKATATKDAYIVIAGINSTAPTSKALTFATDDVVADDTVVLYTYSELENEVVSVAIADVVSGVVTEAQNTITDGFASQNLTIDGEKYSTAAKFAGAEVGSLTIKEEYNVYVDAYGYAIFVEKVADLSSDYALVLAVENSGVNNVNGSFTGETRAKLVFTDGTVKIVPTAKKYAGTLSAGDIVTYRVDADGAYTLRAVVTTDKQTDDATFNLTNGKALITKAGDDVYANSATVFVVYNDDDDKWETYTGVKTAPTIKYVTGTEYVDSYTYVKNGMTKVMFIVPDDYSDQVETTADKLMFIHKDSVSNLINDADGSYYQYDVIVNGEIKTIKVDDDQTKTLNGFYKSYTIDKYDIYDNMQAQSADANGDVNGDYTYFEAVGVSKTSEEYTVTFGANTYTVDEDAEFYYVDEDEDIYVSSYGAVSKDANDIAYVVVKDNMVQTMIVVFVDDDEIPEFGTPVVTENIVVLSGTNLYITNDATVTGLEKANAIIAVLKDAGYTDIQNVTVTSNGSLDISNGVNALSANGVRVSFNATPVTGMAIGAGHNTDGMVYAQIDMTIAEDIGKGEMTFVLYDADGVALAEAVYMKDDLTAGYQELSVVFFNDGSADVSNSWNGHIYNDATAVTVGGTVVGMLNGIVLCETTVAAGLV